MNDSVDLIMDIMETAFDPAFGEAWNRRQVSDALSFGNYHYVLLDQQAQPPGDIDSAAAGFILSRQSADEEELLLIGVRPEFRRMGIASALIEKFIQQAQNRGSNRLFLEMRDGNPAEKLYLKHSFISVGRRTNYYNRGQVTEIDAITFSRKIKNLLQ